MSLNLKFRTCLITFMLLISSFTLIFINSDTAIAEDPLDDFSGIFDLEDLKEQLELLLSFFDEIFHPHPYRVVGAYEINETTKISGDVIFNLYLSSTIIQQFGKRYKDKINVSLHHYSDNGLTGIVKKIENASLTIQLDPDFSEGDVHKQDNVIIKNVDHTLYEGDYLLISVEIIQSKKPIYNIAERAYERTIRPLFERLANILNNSQDPSISELGGIIKELLSSLEELGISVEDIAYLFNSVSSSKFFYGSESFKSSIFIPLSNSEDNKTLYFHNMLHELDILTLGNIKTVNETKPLSSTDNMWPPLSVDFESETGIMDFTTWLLIWILYNIEEGIISQEDIVTFYLSDENKLVTDKPTKDSPSRIKLKKDTEYKWEGISFSRNKIIKNVTAELFLYYSKILLFKKITINVTLFDENLGEAVSSVVKQLDRTKILEIIFRRPNNPTIFEFNDVEGEELWYNHEYSLIISYSGGPLFTLRSTHLLFHSKDFPSSITFELEETDNIKITNEIEDKDVIPGGSAEFEFNIESKYSDTIRIEVISKYEEDLEDWNINVPEPVSISEGEKEKVKVIVTSKNDHVDAYGEEIDLIFKVIGDTGFDSKKAEVDVSENAADYYIEVDVPAGKEIKHGTSDKYIFKIKNKNTGYMADSYEIIATSEHDWPLEVDYNDETYIDVDEELTVNVTITVPAYTEISSDKLILSIKSSTSEEYDKLKTVNVDVTTTVISPNILENIYHFFETTAKSLGLDDVLGNFAAIFLIFIIITIIIIFLLVIVYLLGLKYVDIICLDRIKEINPDDKAEFDLEIQNPYKKKLTYELRAINNSDPKSWEISLDNENIVVVSKQKQAVKLTVEPTDFVKQNEWVEIKIIARAIEKQKEATISTVTSIKDAKPDVRLIGVFHWPRIFKQGQRIVTSFKVENRGNVSTDKISIILYVNGEEKNKVEEITIPRGGYAEVEMSWIAVKGKNQVNIVVK